MAMACFGVVCLLAAGVCLAREDLWRVERANAAACEHIVESLEATITTDPTYRGVVTMSPRSTSGGVGNVLDVMTHAALLSLALNRSLCAQRAANLPTLSLMASPALGRRGARSGARGRVRAALASLGGVWEGGPVGRDCRGLPVQLDELDAYELRRR